ncbi:unnamed protein product [Blepharisma stoltei]|uniref:Par3/HAL N-terminal domain-containing protein n=1 Tax=Blepharisma stoltei TaxID=1481888 RepID=A0AAU9JIT2_9CILI|nr:unnamed protein product [Blepharisma stoltei]
MIVHVHIKDQIFPIQCGTGCQRLQWLGDVGVFRYEHFFNVSTGVCKALELEDGTALDVGSIISDTIPENSHVWVVLQEDEIAKKREELDDTSSKVSSVHEPSLLRPRNQQTAKRK